jgi:hypothetical protein
MITAMRPHAPFKAPDLLGLLAIAWGDSGDLRAKNQGL